MSAILKPEIIQEKAKIVTIGICSVCRETKEVYYSYSLPKTKKLLVSYCIACFDTGIA